MEVVHYVVDNSDAVEILKYVVILKSVMILPGICIEPKGFKFLHFLHWLPSYAVNLRLGSWKDR